MGKGFSRQGEDPLGMMGKIQKLQQQLEAAQARLAEQTVTGSAGGGVVKVTMTGDQKCQSIEISPRALQGDDPKVLEGLILSAINQALERSRALAAKSLGPLSGGLPF